MDIINLRRSVREYTNEKITKEDLDKIVRAGMQAPSAMNQRPWRILVVTDENKLQRLASLSKILERAKACIILFYEQDKLTAPEMVQCDMGACTQNMLLECVSLGLGACWIGMNERPKRHEVLHNVFRIPKNFIPFSIIAIGHPFNKEANYFLDRFEKEKVFYEEI